MRFWAKYPTMLLFMLAAVAILGWAVMLLWNLVVPALLVGAHTIDFSHAVGLLILCRLLFGGFRGHRGGRGHGRWRRWAALTPEEREHMLKSRGSRC